VTAEAGGQLRGCGGQSCAGIPARSRGLSLRRPLNGNSHGDSQSLNFHKIVITGRFRARRHRFDFAIIRGGSGACGRAV